MAPHFVRRRWFRIALALSVVVLTAQVANTLVVRRKICDLLASPGNCPVRGGLGSLALTSPAAAPNAPIRLRSTRLGATTWLLRRNCSGGWTLAPGATADAPELIVDTDRGVVQVERACLSAGRAGWSAVIEQARLRVGECAVRLAPFRVSSESATEASVDVAIDPPTAAACSALLSDSMRQGFGNALVGSTLRLTIRYERPTDGSSIADAFADITERGDVRRALMRVPTSHRLEATLPDGNASVEIGTMPAGDSVAMRLELRASDAIARLMPADVRPAAGPLALDLRWDLDHASGVVSVNGTAQRRRAAGPTRASGLLALPSSECGASGPARSLYFVEADDHGAALLPSQTDAVHAAVDTAMGEAGALVTVFVHGWQHSAAPDDSYVCRFADVVASIENMESRAAAISRRPARRVIGIYVGWSGSMYDNALANVATTFWNRLHAADSLGGAGSVLRPLLTRLAQRVEPGRVPARADRRSSLIVVGHSMGARAVFNALRDDLIAGTRASASAPDMTLLVNPAFSATQYRAVHDRSRECTPDMAPVLLFSSEADAVTRQIYPAGQTVTYASVAGEAAPFFEHVYTAANFAEFGTHRLSLETVSGPAPALDGPQTLLRGFERVPTGSRELYSDNPVVVYRQPATGRPRAEDVWYRVRLTPLEGVAQCSAARPRSAVVAVDPQLLPDHGNIFTPPFVEYIARVLNAQAVEARPSNSRPSR